MYCPIILRFNRPLDNRRQGCAASGAPNARIVQRTCILRYLRGHRLRTRAMIGRVKSDRLLDFAHIPVGVLSQAYEHYLHSHAPLQQRKEGGYYTPRLIADLMVRGAFHALRRDEIAYRAKILDPAAGAGVFLITAFRQLVAERWRHDKRRPDTKMLRRILYSQIVGFDINEAALRFAALGLYLISIELDPHPEPLPKLRFEKSPRNGLTQDWRRPQ